MRRAGGVRGLCVSECIWGMGGLTSRRGASRSNVCIVEREVHWPGGGVSVVGWGVWWHRGTYGRAARRVMVLGWRRCQASPGELGRVGLVC